MASKTKGAASAAREGAMAGEPATELPAKTCGCTGVRWCAECRAPERRAAWKLRPPIATPAFLRERPVRAGRTACGSRVYVFDPSTQGVPGLPGFSGLVVLPDFVSQAEAEALLAEIEATPFAPAQSGKQKQHFGAKANFRKRRLNAAHFTGLPGYARALEGRLRARLAVGGGIDQGSPGPSTDLPPGLPRDLPAGLPPGLAAALAGYVTTDAFVLRYHARQGSNLDVHVDDTWAYGELILDLSLETDAWMTFLDRDPQDGAAGPFTCVRAELPARSLALLFGPARFAWHHGIASGDIQGRRTSITLRTLADALRASPEGRVLLEVSERST